MDEQLKERIVSIGLQHHCLGCVADGSFCPTYEELPAHRRGVRDTIVTPILELLATEYDRGKVETLEYLARAGNEFTKKTGSLEAGYAHIRDLIQDGLKSKGEV